MLHFKHKNAEQKFQISHLGDEEDKCTMLASPPVKEII